MQMFIPLDCVYAFATQHRVDWGAATRAAAVLVAASERDCTDDAAVPKSPDIAVSPTSSSIDASLAALVTEDAHARFSGHVGGPLVVAFMAMDVTMSVMQVAKDLEGATIDEAPVGVSTTLDVSQLYSRACRAAARALVWSAEQKKALGGVDSNLFVHLRDCTAAMEQCAARRRENPRWLRARNIRASGPACSFVVAGLGQAQLTVAKFGERAVDAT